MEAQTVNDSLELDTVKNKLYEQEIQSSESLSNLMTENQRLNNQNARLEKLCRKLNKKLRSAEKKADSGIHMSPSMGALEKSTSLFSLDQNGVENSSVHSGSLDDNFEDNGSLAAFGGKGVSELTRKPDVPRQGILKFNPTDLKIVVNSVLDAASKCVPPRCGAAFLIFMALRHTDATNDDALLKELLIDSINGLKKMGKKNERTLPGISMWTCIAIRLTHLIFQYSGEPDACLLNSAQQNAHCLRNFDINEFRGVFQDTATSLYKKMMMLLQEKLKPIIVSAMLDHDSLQGTSAGKSIEDLLREINTSLDLIKEFGCDDVVLRQICQQLVYYVVSISLNQLLARRDLCNWTKAMQLRYNVSQVEEFLSRRSMRDKGMMRELAPLVQASQLMQVKKQDEKDADSLLAMCDSLTGAQVLKLLQLITPVHEYEERVPSRFLALIKQKISKNSGILQRDVNLVTPPDLPYVPSPVVLSDLEIPHEVRKYAQLV